MKNKRKSKPSLLILAWTLIAAALLVTTWALHSFSAEGTTTHLVFARDSNIWIANTDGTGQRQLTFSNQDKDPVLSPDGRLVAFTSRRGEDPMIGYGNLYLIPSAGGRDKTLKIAGMTAAEHPAFSADGKQLVFVGLSNVRTKGAGDSASVYATMSIMVLNMESQATRTLLTTRDVLLDAGYVYTNPFFSPDGTLVAFQHSGSDVSGGFEVVDLNGKKVFSFPKDRHGSVPYWRPRFFRDGLRLLCYSPVTSEKGKDMIYAVDMKRGNKKAITEGANPTFVEDGTAIVFERWANKWTENARPDLWYLGLRAGAKARKIVTNGSEPSGIPLSP